MNVLNQSSAVVEFSDNYLDYMGSEWLDDVENGRLLKKLSHVPRSKKKLAIAVREHFDLVDIDPNLFSDEVFSFVYLSSKAKFESIALCVGLCVCSKLLVQASHGADIRRHVEDLGDQNYKYLLRAADTFKDMPKLPTSLLEIDTLGEKKKSLKLTVFNLGLRCIAYYCLQHHWSVNRRLVFKLPLDWAQLMTNPYTNIKASQVHEILDYILQSQKIESESSGEIID